MDSKTKSNPLAPLLNQTRRELSSKSRPTLQIVERLDTRPVAAPIEGLSPEDRSLDAVIRKHIVEVYEAAGRNVSRAATVLKISRQTLRSHLQQYGILPMGYSNANL
jgi:DNA-binding NtrC family response regulator